MQAFIDKWGTGTADFLLPIITCEKKDCRLQYQSAMSYMNILLKQVGAMAGVNIPLTTYVARHSWASIARSRNIPLSVISEGMGHDSERTTQIYLSSLESSVIDRANRLVIKALQG